MSLTGAVDSRVCTWHGEREAAAACLDCGRTLCRECALEIRGRITCRSCAETSARGDRAGLSTASTWSRAPYAALGLAGLWAVFYILLQWIGSSPGQYLLH